MGEIPFTGNLKVGHNVQIGYFAQNQAQLLDGEISVFDTIDRVAKGDIRLKIKNILGAFMFGDDTDHVKGFKYFPQFHDYNEIGEVLAGRAPPPQKVTPSHRRRVLSPTQFIRA